MNIVVKEMEKFFVLSTFLTCPHGLAHIKLTSLRSTSPSPLPTWLSLHSPASPVAGNGIFTWFLGHHGSVLPVSVLHGFPGWFLLISLTLSVGVLQAPPPLCLLSHPLFWFCKYIALICVSSMDFCPGLHTSISSGQHPTFPGSLTGTSGFTHQH